MTRVCSLAFVNVWSKKKSSILDVNFASLMPSHGRKIDFWPSLHACAESYHPVRPMSSKYGQLFRLFLNLPIYDDDYYFARPFLCLSNFSAGTQRKDSGNLCFSPFSQLSPLNPLQAHLYLFSSYIGRHLPLFLHGQLLQGVYKKNLQL